MVWGTCWRFERLERFEKFGSKGSICSMSSKGWGFRKVRSAFPYFLFLVSYSLFLCVRDFVLKKSRMRVTMPSCQKNFASLLPCVLCVKQKKVQKVGDFEKLDLHFLISYF